MTGSARMTAGRGADGIDMALVTLFLFGIYLGWDLKLSAGTPLPCAIAGLAGGLIWLRHFGRLDERSLVALLAVIALYVASILCVGETRFLGERFKGLVQICYSLLIGYGFVLAARDADPRRLARVFLAFALAIVAGAALENYTAFQQVSDRVREQLYDSGIYASDERDLRLYGRVRPKLFTSEPSYLTFGFTLFAFGWYVLSTWRFKLAGYLALLAIGLFLMRGPTLLLGVALIAPYQLFLASRRIDRDGVRLDTARAAAALAVTAVLAAAGIVAASTLFSDRVDQILSGQDASFFGRIVAPALVARDVVTERPLAGVGLGGWEVVEPIVRQIYVRSQSLTLEADFESAAHAVTNYVWVHWIFLGLLGGVVMLAALSWLLHALGVPSLLFCWSVWLIMGQSIGAYVSPKTWTVFFLAAVLSMLHVPRPAAAVPCRAAHRRNAGSLPAAAS